MQRVLLNKLDELPWTGVIIWEAGPHSAGLLLFKIIHNKANIIAYTSDRGSANNWAFLRATACLLKAVRSNTQTDLGPKAQLQNEG